MRTPLTVAVAQPEIAPGDVAANAAEHAAAILQADARLVVFPELSLTGYELDAPLLALDDPALAAVVAACAQTGSIALAGAPVDGPSIAVLRIDRDGIQVAYRKSHLGGGEPDRFVPGPGPVAVEVDGWRVGLGVCKDTGADEHVAGVAALAIDLYAAGLVHADDELEEQDRRGRRIAAVTGAAVAFASFAGPTGSGYDRTAGTSTIWGPDGDVRARADARPGAVVGARLG
jgi:predicted amidohydrolase